MENDELAVRAYNYIQQHRGEGARGIEQVQNHPAGPGESGHKGEVKDPKHDHRLSKNKGKDDHEKEEEEKEERARQEARNRNRERLMHLKQLQESRPHAASFSVDETSLRNHIAYGSAISKLLGKNPATVASLNSVRDALMQKTAALSTVDEKNEVHYCLSLVAGLLIEAGALTKHNG